MISESMKGLVANSSAIRAMFEEGARLAKEVGPENVYDFSLGNPNVPAPEAVKKAIIDIVNNDDPVFLHGYMNNNGYEDVRKTIADSLNRRFGTDFGVNNLIMTVGAAGGLNIILKALINPGEKILTFAPFFGEYRNYAANVGGVLEAVPPVTETFQPDIETFEKMIGPDTRAVIINNPNNPTGVIYSEETIKGIAGVLDRKSAEYGNPIYLISDEPYRELAYDGAEVPYLTKYYRNTIIGYSYSKSLSLPGERIGYLVIPSEIEDYQNVYDAAGTAGRILGFVNAPSLAQRFAARCCEESTDVDYYDKNRQLLYGALTDYGFECIKPQGAFYLFMKSPVPDEREFCNAAKAHNILLVQGRSFGCEGFVRLAYCVSRETIERSLPAFRKLAEEYGLGK